MHIINGGRGTVCSYMNHMCTIAFLCEKKKGVRPLELLQTVVYRQLGATAWMPGIEPVFSARAVSALNS